MKRILSLLAALALCLTAVPAFADHWETTELKWSKTRFFSGSSTTPVVVDTQYTCPGGADTTMWFNFENLPSSVTAMLNGSSTNRDTLIVGVVTIVADSAFTGSANITEVSWSMDFTCGKCGDFQNTTTGALVRPLSAVTMSDMPVTSGQSAVALPITAIEIGTSDEVGTPAAAVGLGPFGGALSFRVRTTVFKGTTPWGRSRVFFSRLVGDTD